MIQSSGSKSSESEQCSQREKTAFARAANFSLVCARIFCREPLPRLLSPPECFTSYDAQGTINVKEEDRCRTVE